MILDTALVTIFLASAGTLVYLVSLKIPQLVAIPDEVIEKRLEENSARARVFILNLKAFFKERRYQPLLLGLLGKILYRLHIWFMKLDNWTVKALKKARANGNGSNGNGAKGEYWEKISRNNSVEE